MKKLFVSGALALLSATSLQAKDITITAMFTPSVEAPDNNIFINTTPSSGYCVAFANNCASNGWFSVNLGINANPVGEILENDSLSFSMPSAYRDVLVTNQSTGTMRTVKFAINGFGARMRGFGGDATGVSSHWTPLGVWLYPPPGCQGTGLANGNNDILTWFWRWPNRNDTTVCTKTTTVDRGKSPNFDSVNFMYLLTTPNPLEMDEGVYEGTLTYKVAGSGADINIGGPKYQTVDDQLVINFRLTVTHEMSIKPVETGTINLHACTTGKICTESENKVNWEKATIANIPPVLTAESSFNITSSGSFTTYLQCEFNHGEHCGIKSEKTGTVVPVQTRLTLPGNIETESGAMVRNMLMKNVKDIHHALFRTSQFAPGGKGKFYFEVDKQNVSEMKKHAPDEYSGVVTVIFDPQVW